MTGKARKAKRRGCGVEMLEQIQKISSTIGNYVLIPFIFLSIFMAMFAVIGLSHMYEDDPNGLDDLGGFDLWFNLTTVYALLSLVLLFTFMFSSFSNTKSKEAPTNGN